MLKFDRKSFVEVLIFITISSQRIFFFLNYLTINKKKMFLQKIAGRGSWYSINISIAYVKKDGYNEFLI